MASLPSQYPDLALHLSDTSLAPIITSSSARFHDGLTTLASASLSSHAAALRFGLGEPRRITVEHTRPRWNDKGDDDASGKDDDGDDDDQEDVTARGRRETSPLPRRGRKIAAGTTTTATTTTTTTTILRGPVTIHSYLNPADLPPTAANGLIASPASSAISPTTAVLPPPPMLLGVVAAPSQDYLRQARRAGTRLERVGRQFQHEWSRDDWLNGPPGVNGAGDGGATSGGGAVGVGLGLGLGRGRRGTRREPSSGLTSESGYDD